jgi:ubiquinone biosynthesis protein UbiJ
MIDQLAAGAVVALLNRLLARESWARERLAPYAGKVALFEAPPLALRFGVREGGLLETPGAMSVAAAAAAPADVTLGFDLASLPNLLVDRRAVMRNVRLSGDADFAHALSEVLQNLRPEFEEDLAPFVGDAAAVRIVGFLREALAQAQQSAARLSGTAADYFVAENPLIASRADVEAFVRDVNRLRDDVERLAKRLDALQRG